MTDLNSVGKRIAEAKAAAAKIGISYDRPRNHRIRVTDSNQPWRGNNLTSYGLEIEGINNAADVSQVIRLLEAYPGVQVSLNFLNSVAWVTAPDVISPSFLIERLKEHGFDAQLTPGSLQRRTRHRDKPDHPRFMREHEPVGAFRRYGRLPRSEELRLQRLRSATAPERSSGFLRAGQPIAHRDEATGYEVLFTARELITKWRLLISVIFTVPILVMSYFESLQFDYWQYVCFALATPVVTYCAWPFHRAALGGFRRGMSALDAASSLAIIAAFCWSIFLLACTPAGSIGWDSTPSLFAYDYRRITDGELFLDVACGTTVFLLFGRILSRRTRSNLLEDWSQREVSADTSVTVVRRSHKTGKPNRTTLPLSEVRNGDDIIVPTGAMIPADGNVIGGAGEVEHTFIHDGTRYSVKVNSSVFAGSVNRGGPLKIRVSKTGSQTRLAGIRRWLVQATQYSNRSTYIATKSASMLVPAAITIAVLDFGLWWLITNNLNASFASALAVLASVGPVAMALSTSLAMRLGLENCARKGILVRNTETMRKLDDVDTVIFNRVGTLATGEPTVESITAARGEDSELVLRVAGALAMESQHPASRAIVRAAREARDAGTGGDDIPHWIDVDNLTITDAGSFVGMVTIPNKDGKLVTVDAELWRPRELSELRGHLGSVALSGGAPLIVNWDGKTRGVILLHDTIKEDAEDSIDDLEAMGLETIMISRDIYPVARRFADTLGVSKVLAGIAPGKKDLAVRSVHTAGAKVAMIGDSSVLPCLRVADVGVLFGTGESLNTKEADVVLFRDDARSIPEMMALARRVSAVADRNIVFAWAYNIAAMVASIAGVLHPMVATLLMVGSSLVIEGVSSRVRNY